MARPSTLPWDRPGAMLGTVQLNFYAGGVAADWRRLGERLDLDADGAGTGDRFMYAFDLLGAPQAGGGSRDVAFIELHSTGARERAKGNIVHWHVKLRRLIVSKPPAEVEELSQRLGGYPGGFKAIGDAWPEGVDRSVALSYDVNYFLDPAVRTPKQGLPRRKHVNVDGVRHTLEPAIMSWDVSPPRGSVASISLAEISRKGEASVLSMTARGEWVTKVDEHMVSRLDAEVWRAVESFMK